MTRLEKIEREIQSLSDEEFKALAAWMDEQRARQWDARIERDAKAGKLDKLAEKALAAHRAGRTRPL
jgi:cytochrome c553